MQAPSSAQRVALDALFKKKRLGRPTSSASSSSTSQPHRQSALTLDTAASLDDISSVPYERLPTSSPTKAAAHTHASSSSANRASAFPYSSAFPLPGQPHPFDDGTTSPRTTHQERMSHALGNVPPSRASAQARPPMGLGIEEETAEELRGSASGSGSSTRASRPHSPDGVSIRSVTSSGHGHGGGERERRKRVDSLGATSDHGAGRDARGSVSSASVSSPDPSRAPPMSPQRERSSASVASAAGERDSLSSASRQPHLSRMASFRSVDRPASNNGTVASSRSGAKGDYAASTMSSSIPFMPRRQSAASSVASRTPQHTSHDSMYLDAAPSPYSSDFRFPRPPDPALIDAMFDELQARIGTTSAAALGAARGLDQEKKWTLIYNDAYLRWKNAREKLTHRPVEARSAPAVGAARGGSSDYTSSPRIGGGGGGSVASGSVGDRASTAGPSWGKNESPEWYIGRFMNGSITQQQVASLGVCLRTYELKCVLLPLARASSTARD